MHDLDRYTKKTHVAIQSRYISLLGIGSIALVALVFTLGVLVGRSKVKEKTCPEIDPLAALDLKAKEPLPPSDKEKIYLSYHESLSVPKDKVPTPASLLSKEPSGEESIGSSSDSITSVSLKVPTITEPPILEDVGIGEPGVYSLQVGSFKDKGEAERMVRRLERAGHETFLVSVQMPDRGGTWYRIRIGPFSSKAEAWLYKTSFEEKEKLPAFVVKRRVNG